MRVRAITLTLTLTLTITLTLTLALTLTLTRYWVLMRGPLTAAQRALVQVSHA